MDIETDMNVHAYIVFSDKFSHMGYQKEVYNFMGIETDMNMHAYTVVLYFSTLKNAEPPFVEMS